MKGTNALFLENDVFRVFWVFRNFWYAAVYSIDQHYRLSCAHTRERTRLTRVVPKVNPKSWPNAEDAVTFWAPMSDFTR